EKTHRLAERAGRQDRQPAGLAEKTGRHGGPVVPEGRTVAPAGSALDGPTGPVPGKRLVAKGQGQDAGAAEPRCATEAEPAAHATQAAAMGNGEPRQPVAGPAGRAGRPAGQER